MPRRVLAAVAIATVLSASAMLAIGAEEPTLAQPVQAEPQRVETVEPLAPMTMLVEEVELMLEMARRQAENGPPLLSPARERSGQEPGGITRTIEIEVP